jgi:hypothetical protein
MTNGRPRSTVTILLTAGLAAALAACHYEPKVEENAVPRPEEYKEPIQDYVRSVLTDPTGIRNAFISVPALRTVGRDTMRYVDCFKYDGKDNADPRRYASTKEVAAVFFDRRIQQFAPATPELCGQAAYQPYPELERLCREKVCPH